MNEQIEAPAFTEAKPPFDLQSAVEFGKHQVIKTEYKGIPVFVIPDDMKIEHLDTLVDEQLPRPYSLCQRVELLTHESFVEYFNRYATESSTIFVNDKDSTFTAVLDYHDSPNEPAWKRHSIHYSCPKTKEWNTWIKFDGEKMNQENFAMFIEDNAREITNPEASVMLEIASSLKATNNVNFASGIKLSNGEVQFNYTETINGQAGVAGQLSIPEKITLVIRPFMKGAPYEVEARFRYRVLQGGLTMWYSLIRPHASIDDAFTDVVTNVKESILKGHVVHAIAPQL